jgi:hypothetical protein
MVIAITMLNRIKALFFRRPERQSLTMPELPGWLAREEQKVHAKVLASLCENKQSLNSLLDSLEESCKTLETAELQNKNIPVRAYQVMQGNRENYLRRTRDFLNRVRIDWSSIADVLECIATLRTELDSLHESTMRSYLVIKEFFAHEAIAIATLAKKLEREMQDTEGVLAAAHITELKEMRNALSAIRGVAAKRQEFIGIVMKRQDELKKELRTQHVVKGQMDALRASAEFQNWKGLVEEREDIQRRIQAHENELFQHFSVLEAGMKKFSHRGPSERLVIDYITNPALALLDDETRQIQSILDGLRTQLQQGTIELKDAKRERTQKVLLLLTPSYLSSYLATYEELRSARKARDELMRKSTIIQDYNELEYRLTHSGHKVDQIEDELVEEIDALDKLSDQEYIPVLTERLVLFNQTLIS